MMETATLAAGCFWCVEAIFKRLKGVHSVTSGYTGGTMKDPGYEMVSSGTTNHAEAIQVKFDPSVIPYEKLLEIFFYTHNPTTLNQQGYDVGTQYRSAVFYHDEKQKKIAEEVKEKIQREGVWKEKIVTKIEPFESFYKAEEYHQDYYEKNKTNQYCTIVIDPKIQKLMKEYRQNVKEEYQ